MLSDNVCNYSLLAISFMYGRGSHGNIYTETIGEEDLIISR